MPLTGSRDLSALANVAPLVTSLEAEPVTLEGVEILQVMVEIDDAAITSLLPPALHPTIPPTLTAVFWRVRLSPWGPFELAQVRIGCRAGARPRALLLRAYCNSHDASRALAEGWGVPALWGDVRMRRYYDRVVGSVEADGRRILEAELVDPEAISGADIQYIANLNLARVERGDAVQLRLVQFDPEYVFHKADRGRPVIQTFDAAAWAVEGAAIDWPISASYALCDVELPRIRYLVDPALPPLQAVERLARA